MHPAHVEAFVKAEAEELRARAASSGLPILDIELSGTNLYLQLELTRRAKLSAMQQSPLVVAAGGGVVALGPSMINVPDLSQPPATVIWFLHCNLDDFDTQPPSADLLNEERDPLPDDEWPTDVKGQGIVRGHVNIARPWFCRKGFREFHTHPEHENEPWDVVRGEGAPLHALVLGLVSDLNGRFIL